MIRMTLAAAVLAAGPAVAETFDAAGTGHGTSANEVTEIAEGHMVMKASSTYEGFETEGPLAGATGECFGSAEVKAGALSGGGVCVFATAGGETAVVNWHMKTLGEGGATQGDWTVSGGSGKWAAATGGGEFSNLTNPESGKFVNTISGSITFE